MHRSGKGAGLALLLCVLMLTWPGARTYASTAPPGRASRPDGLEVEAAPRGPSRGYFYTVRPGDTLWDIAVAHGLTPEDLTPYNPDLDLDMLHPGDALFIPASPTSVPRKTPPPTRTPTKAPPAPAATTPPKATAATPRPPVATPAPAPAAVPAAAAGAQAPEPGGWQETLLKLINEQRATRKIPALKWSPELAAAAQAHAEDCARRNRGSHVGSDGAALLTRLTRAGYAARGASENWAYAATAAGTFSMWWNEPPGADPHRRNILGVQYKEIGIGIARGPWGYYFVADFGSR